MSTTKSPDALQVTRIWNYRNVQSRREERDVQARRFNEATAAEENLAEVVKNECGFDGIRMRVRAPRYRREDDTAGRGEIDMVLVTHRGIYVIEIKDFYGQVYTAAPSDGSPGEHWMQCARAANTNKKIYVNHGDILNGIRLKAKAVADYLSKTPIPYNSSQDSAHEDLFPGEPHRYQRLEIPAGCVYPCLVFVNPHCVVDPQALASHQFVFTTNSFKQFIGKKNVAQDWAYWLAPVLVPSNNLTYKQQLDALAIVDTLPTWDTITFHNGSVRTGDILSFHFPENKVGKSAKIPLVERRNISDCSMTWPGKSYLGLLWTLVTHSNLPTLYIYLRPGAQRKLDADLRQNLLSGEAASNASSVAERNNSTPALQRAGGGSAHNSPVNSPRRGNRHGAAASSFAPQNNDDGLQLLKFRIGAKPGEPMRSQEVAYIRFRSAGQEHYENIAIHHLSSIQLSLVSTQHNFR